VYIIFGFCVLLDEIFPLVLVADSLIFGQKGQRSEVTHTDWLKFQLFADSVAPCRYYW